MNAPTELFLMTIAEDMVVVNAQSLDVTDP
jgi:hypothetical protein